MPGRAFVMRRKKKNNIKGSDYMAEEKDNVKKEELEEQEAVESVVGEVVSSASSGMWLCM